MNISLTKEFEHYEDQKVESGLYHSASEVIRDGLRLMKDRDDLHWGRLAELHREINLGADQADRQQGQPFTDETTARIKFRGRRRLSIPAGPDQV